MATKKTRRAGKKAKSLAKAAKNKLQRINVSIQPRTLKRSARKQLERGRASGLWILPWLDSKQQGCTGRSHPKASLLGLPSELRQTILYQSCYLGELKDDSSDYYTKPIKSRTNIKLPARLDTALLDKFSLSSKEGELITTLRRKVGVLCRISPLIRQDMEYVCKLWQADLEELFDRDLAFRLYRPKYPRDLEGMEWLRTRSIAAGSHAEQKKNVIRGKEQGGKKKRPQKCWYCTERHYGIDPVCPMARQDPQKWRQITKNVGGRRGNVAAKFTSKTQKIIFDDA
ncbi:hypothetical protein BDU57DRAFT_573134 [Ampelomyces quisqualis]|uniref:Uncharacterized protein n=1 Tax=Ampelomyces quisqualis TaxID=50730 RepID=A0A6A5QLL3_AMPQU|nr:hypothetical protein BDU57DRAFT_573134 [Ampelomyces quisqualis]